MDLIKKSKLCRYKTKENSKISINIQDLEYNNKLKETLNDIKINQMNYIELKKYFMNKSNFNFILKIFKKSNKNSNEIELLNLYLKTLDEFISLIHSDENSIQLNKLLSLINKELKIQIYNANSILFKIGEIGLHYYIILDGKVSILIPEEIKIKITANEYKQHLINLYIMNEKYLLQKTIDINNHILEIDIKNFENNKEYNKYKNLYEISQGIFNINEYLNIINYKKTNFNCIQYLNENYNKIIKEKNNNKNGNKNLFEIKYENYNNNNPIIDIKDNNNYFENNIISKDIPSSFISRDKNKKESYKYFFYSTEINYNENKINLIDDNINNNNNEIKFIIKLIGYKKVGKLENGQPFGELSLITESNNLRTSTIFIEKETILGSLTKCAYNNTIKSAQIKIKKENCMFILNTNLFENISYFKFLNKYFVYFNTQKLNKGDLLFNINDQCNNIYIINQGELKLDCYLDSNNIDIIINYLEGKDINKQLQLIKYKNEINKIKKNKNSIFNKYQYIPLFIIKKGDILGLKDIIFINNKYFTNGEVISDYLTFYTINKNIFNDFMENDIIIKNNFIKLEKFKINLMINRLKDFKNVLNKINNNLNNNNNINNNIIIIKIIILIKKKFVFLNRIY